jgi:5-methylcytosine-specific restriction endonuclease McrA
MNKNDDYFLDVNPSVDTVWRSIILLGRNVASYKFALAKSLLEIDTSSTKIKLEELAIPFANNICSHLTNNDKQITSSSSKFIETCRRYNLGEITKEDLREKTVKLGFVNVIDAFHNLAGGETSRFFSDNRSDDNSIILTDNFYRLKEKDTFNNLIFEAESRWNLWETAISLEINPSLLQVKNDSDSNILFIINKDKKRKPITSSRDALNGYQKGNCFYCSKPISIKIGNENTCHVDHFFPHKLKDFKYYEVDQIWNLVLSCPTCNNGEKGKFMKIPEIKFLRSLEKRNNYYINSHHPLRETIINQTGKTSTERRDFLKKMYTNAISRIPVTWKPIEKHGELL